MVTFFSVFSLKIQGKNTPTDLLSTYSLSSQPGQNITNFEIACRIKNNVSKKDPL
jgi:hypothetical protein